METRRQRTVGVVGGGSGTHRELARCVGRIAAELGCHLLTGGGGGMMATASRAFCEVSPRKGICIGVLEGRTHPESTDAQGALVHRSTSPNDWVKLPIKTHLPHSGSRGRSAESRNHINVLSSDVLVALPGGRGTDSEVTLAKAGPSQHHVRQHERMMDLLAAVGRPGVHIAVAPGCDGETRHQQLEDSGQELTSAGRYLGCFSVEPLLPVFRTLAAPLAKKRTPNIIVDAAAANLEAGSAEGSLIVPPGMWPEIPGRWLSVALAIRPRPSTV